MKKYLSFLVLLISCFTLVSCKEEELVRVLRVYNWQDYIDDGVDTDTAHMLDDFTNYYFETYGEKIEVTYDTFETNESMFNTLKTGKTTYDLVCPSEYMIMRMLKNDMLIPFEADSTPVYNQYASKYIQNVFKNVNVDENYTLADYAKCYMWGTLGLVYDPEYVSEEDMKSWDVMWDPKYEGMVSTKDSIRDTYVVGVMHTYKSELVELKSQYESGELTDEEYNSKVNQIMNRCDDDTIKKVLSSLQALKDNLFGFEVDSGKTDIVNGKIRMNLAWSGDAVYSMQLAEEEDDKILAYAVPEEGSNIWFDGWVMPKGADTELACAFVDFVSKPENAARNMNYIGYTSAIAGQEVFDTMVDWYDETEVDPVEEGLIPYDLSYFFEGTLDEGVDAIIWTSSLNGQLYTQYPDLETVNRCAVMQDFGSQNNEIIEMWSSVKATDLPMWFTITFFVVVVALIIFAIIYSISKKKPQGKVKRRSTKKVKYKIRKVKRYVVKLTRLKSNFREKSSIIRKTKIKKGN